MLPTAVQRQRIQQSRDRIQVEDLHTQYESLLDCIWRRERIWKLEDRIDGDFRYVRRL